MSSHPKHVIEREQFVRCPVEQAFSFCADPASLPRITPQDMSFRVRTKLPVEMREGVEIDYDIRIGGFPVLWRSRIDVWKPGSCFVDRQVHGPYRAWRHEHKFVRVAGGTRVLDRVEFELPFGPFGAPALPLVRQQLDQLFDHRKMAIARILTN